MRVIQSNQSILDNGIFTLSVCITKRLTGSGGNGRKTRNCPPAESTKLNHNKTSVVTIKNKDHSCGYRALFVAKYSVDNGNKKGDNVWRQIKENKYDIQMNGAKSFGNLIGINIETEPMTLEILEKIQNKSPYQIICYSDDNSILYRGPRKLKQIYICNSNNHYNAITSITGYLGSKKYCVHCYKAYNHQFHKCHHLCVKCNSSAHEIMTPEVKCNSCNRTFNGTQCYENHLGDVCKKKKQCSICLREYESRKSKHNCEIHNCQHCGEKYKYKHNCHIKPLQDEEKKPIIVVTYDKESAQDVSTGKSLHQSMLSCSKTACDSCFIDNTKNEDCAICCPYNHTFFGYKCVKDFNDYLIDLSTKASKNLKNIQIRAITHNAKGNDGHFVLKDISRAFIESPKIILQGLNY